MGDPASAAKSLALALNCTGVAGNSSSSGGSGTNSSSSLGNNGTSSTSTNPRPDLHQGKSSGPHNQDPVMDCLQTKHFSLFSNFSPNKFSIDFGPTVDGVVIKPYFRVKKTIKLLKNSSASLSSSLMDSAQSHSNFLTFHYHPHCR